VPGKQVLNPPSSPFLYPRVFLYGKGTVRKEHYSIVYADCDT